MSFTDRLVLWLHIAFAVFTLGPVTAAIMSTPRYIRTGNLIVLRYLYRTTRIFGLISLGVLIFGIVLGGQLDVLAKPWITAALTLFVVSLVLLIIVMRDQHKAISAMEVAEAAQNAAAGVTVAVADPAVPAADARAAGQAASAQPGATGAARHVASVERGRITTLGAVVTIIWLVILVLMVWR